MVGRSWLRLCLVSRSGFGFINSGAHISMDLHQQDIILTTLLLP